MLRLLLPEPLRHVFDSVNADTVELLFTHYLLDPAIQLVLSKLVLLVQIWQACDPAVFDLPLVVPVVDFTVIVLLG